MKNLLFFSNERYANLTWHEVVTIMDLVYDFKVLVDVPCTSDRLSVNRDDGNLYSSQLTEQRLNLPQIQTRMLV